MSVVASRASWPSCRRRRVAASATYPISAACGHAADVVVEAHHRAQRGRRPLADPCCVGCEKSFSVVSPPRYSMVCVSTFAMPVVLVRWVWSGFIQGTGASGRSRNGSPPIASGAAFVRRAARGLRSTSAEWRRDDVQINPTWRAALQPVGIEVPLNGFRGRWAVSSVRAGKPLVIEYDRNEVVAVCSGLAPARGLFRSVHAAVVNVPDDVAIRCAFATWAGWGARLRERRDRRECPRGRGGGPDCERQSGAAAVHGSQ